MSDIAYDPSGRYLTADEVASPSKPAAAVVPVESKNEDDKDPGSLPQTVSKDQDSSSDTEESKDESKEESKSGRRRSGRSS